MSGYDQIIIDLAAQPFLLFLVWLVVWAFLVIVVSIPLSIIQDVRRRHRNNQARKAVMQSLGSR